ncbi:MAG: hypothetical protein ACJATS_000070, partial [Psychroserpens sp.]
MNKFENFPGHSKVWIYQSNRDITETEVQGLLLIGQRFVDQWKSHGAPVNGAIDILYNRFVIFVAEDNGEIGGCSIDSSVGVIRKFQEDLNVDFLSRMNLAFLDGEDLCVLHISKLNDAVKAGTLASETVVFDNTVV